MSARAHECAVRISMEAKGKFSCTGDTPLQTQQTGKEHSSCKAEAESKATGQGHTPESIFWGITSCIGGLGGGLAAVGVQMGSARIAANVPVYHFQRMDAFVVGFICAFGVIGGFFNLFDYSTDQRQVHDQADLLKVLVAGVFSGAGGFMALEDKLLQRQQIQ